MFIFQHKFLYYFTHFFKVYETPGRLLGGKGSRTFGVVMLPRYFRSSPMLLAWALPLQRPLMAQFLISLSHYSLTALKSLLVENFCQSPLYSPYALDCLCLGPLATSTVSGSTPGQLIIFYVPSAIEYQY